MANFIPKCLNYCKFVKLFLLEIDVFCNLPSPNFFPIKIKLLNESQKTILGSRRPSLASIHSSTSSAKSYSARRFERERNEKEQRLLLNELKLTKQREQQQMMLTPSPRTPHSTDELLPVEEGSELFFNEVNIKKKEQFNSQFSP